MQESWVDWPGAFNYKVGNILLSRVMGAEVRLVQAEFGIGFKDSWNRAIDHVRAVGGTPYPRRCLRPSARRPGIRQLGLRGGAAGTRGRVFFDTVVVCSVTGSPQGGMIAGFAGQDRPRRVLGIDVSADAAAWPGRSASSVMATSSRAPKCCTPTSAASLL